MANLQLLTICLIVLINLVNGQQHDHSDHDDHNHEQHRVNVTVYYESLCPDSIKFITKQLYPALQTTLSDFINLTLLPYGRAKTTPVLDQYEFTCRHGPNECYSNKLHVCALNSIIKKDQLGYNKIAVGFIDCLMEKIQPGGGDNNAPNKLPTRDCAVINNVNNLNDLENCANHVDGAKLLANIGKLTEMLQPPLKSVPTIVFNNQYKEDDTQMAQENFVKTICKYIKVDHQPIECQMKNSSSIPGLSFLMILGVVIMKLFI